MESWSREGRSGDDDDDTRNQNAELSNVFICRTCLNVLWLLYTFTWRSFMYAKYAKRFLITYSIQSHGFSLQFVVYHVHTGIVRRTSAKVRRERMTERRNKKTVHGVWCVCMLVFFSSFHFIVLISLCMLCVYEWIVIFACKA